MNHEQRETVILILPHIFVPVQEIISPLRVHYSVLCAKARKL